MANTQNINPWSLTTMPQCLNLFPSQAGDLTRMILSPARNERIVSLAHLRNISEEENNVDIASYILTLSIKPDMWDIKKSLTRSDVGNNQTRLMIRNGSVIEHILKHLTIEEIKMIKDENNQGLRINVYDNDSHIIHQMSFKRWSSTGSYVLNNNWYKEFVKRRNLKVGDKIGLFGMLPNQGSTFVCSLV